MSQRTWVQWERPHWAREQAARLDEAHRAQMKIHEDWCKEERDRQWWQEWEDSWSWGWAEDWWKADWSGGPWSRRGWSWIKQEPTALSRKKGASSSSWEEDKDPKQVSIAKVHEDMGTHRQKALTPVSFQPQRHITMILGRPVMVLMCLKILGSSYDK